MLTGGIHTNAFRPKRKYLGKARGTTAPELQIVFYVDGQRHAEQALEYLRGLDEVAEVMVHHGSGEATPIEDL